MAPWSRWGSYCCSWSLCLCTLIGSYNIYILQKIVIKIFLKAWFEAVESSRDYTFTLFIQQFKNMNTLWMYMNIHYTVIKQCNVSQRYSFNQILSLFCRFATTKTFSHFFPQTHALPLHYPTFHLCDSCMCGV